MQRLPFSIAKTPESGDLSSLRSQLLKWFARHHRELPWRCDRDAYRIWVSEVMLQQTTVATVVSRFQQFVERFPTIHELAEADEQEVLRLWEGLGYYRRARDLHQAARVLVDQHAGKLPNDEVVWAQLPGVGRYILGAVLSQAFDRRLPIVEANSKRVLCRLFGQKGDSNSRSVRNWLWKTAESLLPKKRAGDFNQAVMELGALICTPRNPACARCPLSAFCRANQLGLQESIPAKAPAAQVEEIREAAVVIRRGAEVLLVRRPETGRWANMWEFPHAPLEPNETPETALTRLLSNKIGIEAEIAGELATVKHAVMRYRITMICLEANYRAGQFVSNYYKEGRWLTPMELRNYPVSSPQRKLTALL